MFAAAATSVGLEARRSPTHSQRFVPVLGSRNAQVAVDRRRDPKRFGCTGDRRTSSTGAGR